MAASIEIVVCGRLLKGGAIELVHIRFLEDRSVMWIRDCCIASAIILTAGIASICTIGIDGLNAVVVIERHVMGLLAALTFSRTLSHGYLLVIERHTACSILLGERIDTLHISLQQVVLVLDLVLDQVLELLHLYLDDDLVDVRVAILLFEGRSLRWNLVLLAVRG